MPRIVYDFESQNPPTGEASSIPLLTADEEERMRESSLPQALPILALRNTVLFPGVVLPITVGRDASLNLVKDAYAGDRLIGVIAQRDAEVEAPGPDDLYRIGTAATILKLIKMPDGSVSIVIQGKRRFELKEVTQREPYLRAHVEALPEERPSSDDLELAARVRSIKELAVQIVHLAPNLPSEAAYAIQNIDSPSFLIHFIASNLQIDVAKKQELLETGPILERANLVLKYLEQELKVLQITEEIRSKVKTDVDQQQREYLLRQQMKAIQEELGETEGGFAEAEELRERLAARGEEIPEHARQAAEKEISKLARTNPASPEYGVTRNYVETILDLPWNRTSEDRLDIGHAREVLEEDHYGLEDVKRRILEYLAVLKLKGDMKAPILCFVGPPGVGKTSLGKSIARALGRKFVRVSLGGVRDEAEIRGHRRTYVGALPGRIIQGMKKAGTANPVFMLDEIDKLGADFRGDPSSALLEVLDPEQNNAFSDHYLELDYDLSHVLFIATANYLDLIPAPLRDRMEIIELAGYTEEEKLHIARKYLIPKQAAEHGVTVDEQIEFTDEGLREIIVSYTREAGVRNLEREIATLVRKQARRLAEGKTEKLVVDAATVRELLGAPKFRAEREVTERVKRPGVSVGLVWTPAGGDIVFIEATRMRGGKQFTITGHLGEVMQESVRAALSWVRANAARYGIDEDFFRREDIHVHVPAGAIPKDGPSAGVAMVTALVSLLSERPLRAGVAMTGEISLSGVVLPVGGIKEKILGARRAGIREVILPAENEVNVKEDVQPHLLDGLKLHFVRSVDQALEIALTPAEPARQGTDPRRPAAPAGSPSPALH